MTEDSVEFPDLLDCESVCDAPDELLRRQVHPSWVHKGEPSSQAFRPTKKDAGCLSTRRAGMTPREAFDDHIANGHQSAGTWSLSVADVVAVETRAIDDSSCNGAPAQHAYVDFRPYPERKIERISKKLKSRSLARGCLYSPDLE